MKETADKRLQVWLTGAPSEPKLLITGFGPFPGVDKNPSEQLVRDLDTKRHAAKITKAILPTEWERCAQEFKNLVASEAPQILLHFGVHSKTDRILLETKAKNIIGHQIDARGDCLPENLIETQGPPELISTLNTSGIATALEIENMPAACSDDAGNYLCNFLYYKSLAYCAEQPQERCTLFIHIPNWDNQHDISMSDLDIATHNIISACLANIAPKPD